MNLGVLYVGNYEDALVKRALKQLALFEGAREEHLRDGAPAPLGSVMLILRSGDFPSRFARIVKDTDPVKRRIFLPETAQYAAKIIALNKAAEIASLQRPEGLRESLWNIHLEISGIQRPVSNSKKRAHHKSGYQARQRREHMGIQDRHEFPL